MSDNIDYDELDKAVKAATSARNAAKAQPKPAPAPSRPVVKNTTVKRPATRGVVMDFAPRHVVKKRIIRPAPRPAPQPEPETPVLVKKPAKKIAAPLSRLINRPAAKSAPKTVAKPTMAPSRPASKSIIRPASKPVAAKPVAAKPIARPVAPRPAQPTAAMHPAAKPVVAKPTVSRIEQQRPVAKPKPETAPAPAIKRREAPNANNYSLGGRSPFMTNAKVEKRPLGSNIPETSAAALRSTHNVYSQKSPIRATENARKHIVAQDTEKKSGWLWTLAVIGIIAAGGGLGYLAYIIFFAH